jgi:WD40 repeat protein
VPTLGPETVVLDTTDPDRPTVAHRITTGIGASPSAGYAHGSPLLATSGGDKTIRLWDMADATAPRELSSFTAPPGEIYWTAFSADDDLLMLTSSTGQVTVVDVSDPTGPQPWAVLGSTTDPLLYQGRSASPTGGLLAVGVEGAMWMWQLDPDRVVSEACAGGVQLTAEEWDRHFPDTEPFDLCG